MRYVKTNSQIYDHACCALCGTGWGAAPGAAKSNYVCKPSTCMACGSTVCQSHGLGNGHCPICFVGRLSGWSTDFMGTKCRYKGCTGAVVGDDGKWPCCKEHLEKRRPGAIERALYQRDNPTYGHWNNWKLVDDRGYHPHRY